jgi:hypothetical protein
MRSHVTDAMHAPHAESSHAELQSLPPHFSHLAMQLEVAASVGEIAAASAVTAVPPVHVVKAAVSVAQPPDVYVPPSQRDRLSTQLE